MKIIFCVLTTVVLSLGNIIVVSAQEENKELISSDKRKLSKKLVELRDSIDNSILAIQKKLTNEKISNKEQLRKAYNDLSLQRSGLESIIEEVVTTSEQTWTDLKISEIAQLVTRRKEYYQILNDIKLASESKSYQ